MKFTVNQHHSTSVSLLTDTGYMLGYFTSIDEALDTCNEWYSTNSREQKYDVKVIPLTDESETKSFFGSFTI